MTDDDPRQGSVIARGKPRPAWQTTYGPGGTLYDRADGTRVVAGPAVHDTYASRGSATDAARFPDDQPTAHEQAVAVAAEEARWQPRIAARQDAERAALLARHHAERADAGDGPLPIARRLTEEQLDAAVRAVLRAARAHDTDEETLMPKQDPDDEPTTDRPAPRFNLAPGEGTPMHVVPWETDERPRP